MSKPSWTRHTIFVAVGLVVLLSAALLPTNSYPNWRDGLIPLGVAILSVSILDILFLLSGGNPIEKKIQDILTGTEKKIEQLSVRLDNFSSAFSISEKAQILGLAEIYDCTESYGNKLDWFSLLKNSRHSVDLMGRSLYEWIRSPDFNKIIEEKIIRDGVHFRWLIMDISNEHLPRLEEDGHKIGGLLMPKIKEVDEKLHLLRTHLPDDKKHLFEIKTFTHVPLYCSVLRIDDRYFVTPYLQSIESRNSPLLILEGRSSTWAQIYHTEFDVIWRDSSSNYL